jgi:diguanylate cyclase (GGDEF)-like protein
LERTFTDLDPLGRLPSTCSLCWPTGGPRPPFSDLSMVRALLRMDPILYLRSYRLWLSQTGSAPPQHPPSADEILETLSAAPIARLLENPAAPRRAPGPMLELWWHSLAVATAARDLAELVEPAKELDPEQVFLHGLLHDLGLLSQLSCEVGIGSKPVLGALEWSEHWQLPQSLLTCWLASEQGTTDAHEDQKLVRYVIAGEALASLALGPPSSALHDRPEPADERKLLASFSAEDSNRLIEGLLRRMQEKLALARLSRAKLAVRPSPEDYRNFKAVGVQPPPFERAVLEMLEIGEADSQRKLLNAIVSRAARFLGFDRAFYFRWRTDKTRQGTLLASHENGSGPRKFRDVRPNGPETSGLGRAAGGGLPVVIPQLPGSAPGLAHQLGSDELLAVPIANADHFHGFLLLDHGYSPGRRVRADMTTRALAFAGLAAQNLSNRELRQRQKKTMLEAQTDHLTGLCNRRAAMSRIQEEIELVREKGYSLAVMMLDLDHFKQINDVHGHLTGDRVLASVGQILRRHVRETDLAARIGGEEFLVIEPRTTLQEASIVAARIASAVEEHGSELGVAVTISVGLTELRDSDSVDSVLARSDRALYASKALGRNRFSIDSE